MQKPNPTNSKISDLFAAFYAQNGKDEFESLKENGTPLFSPDDPIMASTHPLDKILLKLVKKLNVTEEYFTEKYKDYALRCKGYHIIQTSNNKSNLLKALKSGQITIKRFLEMSRILGLTPTRYRFEFECNGEPVNVELSDKPDITGDIEE